MSHLKSLLALAFALSCIPAMAADLVAPGATVEKLADGFQFTEGPACDAEGNVFFSDIPNERIHKWSVDGKLLYVADAGDGKTYVYKIQPDGSLTGRKLAAPVGADGMTLDEKGNLYLARNAVQVYSPAGEPVTQIAVPEAPANVCFGGKDRKTLFITARKGLYAIEMNVRGQ